MNLLYTLDGLLKNCKGCSQNGKSESPDIKCKDCSFYPQIRWIGNQLGRKKQMAKLTLEEYQDYKAQGKSDADISKMLDIKQPTLIYYKKQWQISPKQADTSEVKQNECHCKGKEENAEYKQKIEELQHNILSLRNENSQLAEERVSNDRVIQNQKYQLGKYVEELEKLQEEVQALKYFARRYLEV
jgi:chromosome segregation ATPase